MAEYGETDRCTGGTPTASQAHAAYPITNAFDDNAATLWFQSTGGYPKWFKYDFGAGTSWRISKITIKNVSTQEINAFDVDGSNNDSDYTELYSGNCAENDNVQTFEFDTDNETAYRYIRVDITSVYIGAETCQVYEVQMFEGLYPPVGGFSGFSPWVFMKDMWEKHASIWRPNKKILIPQGI